MEERDFLWKENKFSDNFYDIYQTIKDPWQQSHIDSTLKLQTILFLSNVVKSRLLQNNIVPVSLESGCGLGYISQRMYEVGFEAHGADSIRTAINAGKKINPNVKFYNTQWDNIKLWNKIKPNLFLISDLTWYVLPKLSEFLTKIKLYQEIQSAPTYLVHLVDIYSDQRYGKEYFSTHRGIVEFFNLETIYDGEYKSASEHGNFAKSWFLAKIGKN